MEGISTMKVNKSIETDLGTITFEGELDQDDLNMVLSVGLTTLMAAGMITVTKEKNTIDPINIPPVSTTAQ